MITEVFIEDAEIDVINLPNGCLMKGHQEGETFAFVPDISWDEVNKRFTIIQKRNPILTQK